LKANPRRLRPANRRSVSRTYRSQAATSTSWRTLNRPLLTTKSTGSISASSEKNRAFGRSP
jgi:hypothetical protein